MTSTEPRPRTSYLGGPDLAALVGASKYKGPSAIYLQKVQGLEEAVRPPMEWGLRLEAAIAQKYSDETGYTLEQPKTMFHSEYGFIGGSIDFLCTNEPNRLLEVKTAAEEQLRNTDENGEPLWGPAGTDLVPLDYLVQTNHYMGLSGRRRADLAVLFMGARRDFRIYSLEFDPELYAKVVAAGVEFWQTYVVPKVAPPQDLITSSLVTTYLAKQAQAGGAVVEMPAQMLAVALELEEVSRGRKVFEDREEDLKRRILAAMAAMGAQKVQGQAYGANFSLAILGGEEGKPFTAWQPVAYELARRLGLPTVPEDLIFDHTRPGNGKKPYLMPYLTSLRNAIKKLEAQQQTTSIPA